MSVPPLFCRLDYVALNMPQGKHNRSNRCIGSLLPVGVSTSLTIPAASPAASRPDIRAAHTEAWALGIVVPFGFLLLNLTLGQDANWDLRNYHWYNAYSFLNGRFGFDVVPAQ